MMVVVSRDYVACWALALHSTEYGSCVSIGTGMRGKSQIFDLILSRNKQAQALYNDDSIELNQLQPSGHQHIFSPSCTSQKYHKHHDGRQGLLFRQRK